MISRETLFPNARPLAQNLAQAYGQGQLPSTLLFTGKAGVGKMQLCMHVAKLLACYQPNESTPCGACFACRNLQIQKDQVQTPFLWLPPLEAAQKDLNSKEKREEQVQKVVEATLLHPSFSPTYSEKAVHRVECVRDLRAKLNFENRANQVIVIPEADRMSSSVANSLLKILEEAPNNTYFLLVSSRQGRILPTILSRALKVRVPSMSIKEFVGLSGSLGNYHANQLEKLYYFSEGAPGFCLGLDGDQLEELQRMAIEFLERSFSNRTDQLIHWIENSALVKGESFSQEMFLRMVSFIMGQINRLSLGQSLQWNEEDVFTSFLDSIASHKKILDIQERVARVPAESSNLRAQMKFTRLGLEIGWMARGQM